MVRAKEQHEPIELLVRFDSRLHQCQSRTVLKKNFRSDSSGGRYWTELVSLAVDGLVYAMKQNLKPECAIILYELTVHGIGLAACGAGCVKDGVVLGMLETIDHLEML